MTQVTVGKHKIFKFPRIIAINQQKEKESEENMSSDIEEEDELKKSESYESM